ncbi:undecaprenyl-diphosphate phosphatase [Ectothiorhodospiraceae bacterium WFHF3C12]|nr:undecaprenyl-diphosphate phosphatase [Ectothiorhodospiraceae bacterium WFHF3C12]
MTLFQIVVLALIQGITEFLPISSSAHLILVPVLTQWPDQGLAFDLAVHAGTLTAVVGYFHRDVGVLTADGLRSLAQRRHVGQSRLAWAVVIGTIPVGLAGLFFDDFIETSLRSAEVIAATTLGFGVLLGIADRRADRSTRTLETLTWRDAVLVGLAQALALIPGTSRSGITMTAGLFANFSRRAAARFSFLLAIPVTALAAGLKLVEAFTEDSPVAWDGFLVGYLLSAVVALAVIHFFLALLERFGFMPYVIYRLGLGAGLLALVATGVI